MAKLEIFKDGKWEVKSEGNYNVAFLLGSARMHCQDYEWRITASMLGNGWTAENVHTAIFAQSKNAPADTVTPDPLPTSEPETVAGEVADAPESKHSDETRNRVYKAIRSFYRESHGNLADFHAEFGIDTFGLSADAIDEWLQMDADDARLRDKSRRRMEEKADSNAPVADGSESHEVVHVAGLDGGYIVVNSEGHNLYQPTRIRGIADALVRKANKDSSDSKPTPVLTDDLLTESRAGWNERAEGLIADADLPFAEGMDETDAYVESLINAPEMAEIYADLLGSSRKVTGHGRTSRNRAKTRQFKANTGVKVSTVTMERKTPLAAKWREKRELHNKTAMPTPTITGAELLARGIQLVEKPKPLTRFLETRNRKAG